MINWCEEWFKWRVNDVSNVVSLIKEQVFLQLRFINFKKIDKGQTACLQRAAGTGEAAHAALWQSNKRRRGDIGCRSKTAYSKGIPRSGAVLDIFSFLLF